MIPTKTMLLVLDIWIRNMVYDPNAKNTVFQGFKSGYLKGVTCAYNISQTFSQNKTYHKLNL